MLESHKNSAENIYLLLYFSLCHVLPGWNEKWHVLSKKILSHDVCFAIALPTEFAPPIFRELSRKFKGRDTPDAIRLRNFKKILKDTVCGANNSKCYSASKYLKILNQDQSYRAVKIERSRRVVESRLVFLGLELHVSGKRKTAEPDFPGRIFVFLCSLVFSFSCHTPAVYFWTASFGHPWLKPWPGVRRLMCEHKALSNISSQRVH